MGPSKDAKPKITGKLIEALNEAPQRGWTIADMKQDWNVMFPFEREILRHLDS